MYAKTEKPVTVKKPKFVVAQPKPRVDPAALEAFAAQAGVVPPVVNLLDVEPTAIPVENVEEVKGVAEVAAENVEPAKPAEPVVEVVQVAAPAAPANVLSTDRTKAFLLRLLPEQFDRIEKVFAVSSYKSKQRMGEQLLMEAVEELAKKLGIE